MNVQFRKNVQQAFDYSDRHYTLIEFVPQVATRHIIQHTFLLKEYRQQPFLSAQRFAFHIILVS